MKWIAAVVLLAGVILSWGRFALPSARKRYVQWARALTRGQVILYAATMAALGLLVARFAGQHVVNENPAIMLFVAIVAGFLFRAYWAPWLWLGRSREVAHE